MAYKDIEARTTPRRNRFGALLQAVLLLVTVVVPLLSVGHASAAPKLTPRNAAIDKSYINATDVQFNFSYTLSDTTATKAGIMYEFCTTPLGTCTLPTGMNVQTSNDFVSQTGWPNNGTNFAALSEATNVGDCTLNSNAYILCYSRDETVATGVTGGAVTHNISGIVAPSSAQTVYVRVYIYNNDDFLSGNLIQEGVVAVAFVDQLTVTGRVQERLDFCVAAVDDDDALPANVSTCTALSDNGIDIGVIDNSSNAVSPVEPTATNGSDDDYGILMVNTNALNGVSVGYYAENPTSVSSGDTDQLKAFRVVPTNCDALSTSLTDQCFQSALNSGSGTDFGTGGTESFGIQVPCIDTTQGSTSTMGSVPAWYNNADNDTTSATNCEAYDNLGGGTPDTGDTFGWNTTGTADTLASSSTAVDDEIVKIRFGATASASTPSGAYTVVTTYIATATF